MACYMNYDHQAYIRSHKKINRESIYKEGQWVILKDKTKYGATPRRVTKTYLGKGKYPQQLDLFPATVGLNYSMDYEPWQPQPDEWCWFWNSSKTIPELGQYKRDNDGNKPYCAYMTPTASMSVGYFKHCEPFIGELPSHLKDN